MKEVAILLLAALMLNGCGSSTPTVQTSAGGQWQAQMSGGQGEASGFSFITQFTVNTDGSLSVSNFQFLTHNSTSCFPDTGSTVSGTMILTVNANNTVTGTFTFSVGSNGNTLTLNGVVTGTSSNGTTLSGGSITGTWSLTGGTGCNDPTGGSFTMNQSTSG